MLNFCDFIQVYVFTTNHHLNICGIKFHGSVDMTFNFGGHDTLWLQMVKKT